MCVAYMKIQPRITGYKQSVTGYGSQRRHVVVTQREQRKQRDPHSKLNLTSMGNKYITTCVMLNENHFCLLKHPLCGRFVEEASNRGVIVSHTSYVCTGINLNMWLICTKS